MDNVVLFGHLLGVLIFVSGVVVAGVAFESARRRQHAGEIALLLGLSRVGVVLVGLGTILLLVCGLWLVELAGIGFGTGWVSAAISLFVMALILGGWGGQTPKRARKLAAQLAEKDKPVSAELRALLDDSTSRLANYGSSVLVVAVLALMVFKP